MIKMLRRLVALIAIVGVIGLFAYAFKPIPADVDVAEVVAGKLQVTVDEDGKTRIKERYMVSAPLAGRLLRIDLDPGDQVELGETLLATMEPQAPDLLDARTVAEAKARVQASEAALKRMGPLLEKAKAALAYAETELGRLEKLEGGVVSEQDLDRARLNYRTRSEEFRDVRFAEEIARFERDLTEAALLRSQPRDAEATGWNIEILSPINGRVLRVLQESSSVVSGGTPIMELGDPEDLEIEVDVLSRDAVKIKPGATVLVERWGGSETLHGRVRLVEPAAFTKVSALGVEEQRVNVLVDLIDPPGRRATLGDAFRVEARIVIWETQNTVKVPTSALFRTGDQWTVFTIREGVARLSVVKVGQRNDLEAEVHDGVQVGDTVIVHPSDKIADGVQVAVRAPVASAH